MESKADVAPLTWKYWERLLQLFICIRTMYNVTDNVIRSMTAWQMWALDNLEGKATLDNSGGAIGRDRGGIGAIAGEQWEQYGSNRRNSRGATLDNSNRSNRGAIGEE